MGLFGGFVYRDPGNGGINPVKIPGEPSTFEKIEMLFTDVETEGKKRGYDKASEEYGTAFRAIEKEYEEAITYFNQTKNSLDNRSEGLIYELDRLEKEKKKLQKEIELKSKAVSVKFDIPLSSVTSSAFSSVTGVVTLMDGINGILGIVYDQKEKKLKDAEQRGYREAKEIYIKKINKLKVELKEVKEKGTSEIGRMMDMINDLLEAIIDEQTKVAELKILLG